MSSRDKPRGGGVIVAMLRLFGILLLLALVGYNTFETSRLRAEVAALRQERGTGGSRTGRDTATPPKNGGTFLAETKKHAERAEAFLRQKQYDDARREIALAAQAAGKATSQARSQGDSALSQLRETVEGLSEKAGALYELQKKASELTEAAKKAGEGEKERVTDTRP